MEEFDELSEEDPAAELEREEWRAQVQAAAGAQPEPAPSASSAAAPPQPAAVAPPGGVGALAQPQATEAAAGKQRKPGAHIFQGGRRKHCVFTGRASMSAKAGLASTTL